MTKMRQYLDILSESLTDAGGPPTHVPHDHAAPEDEQHRLTGPLLNPDVVVGYFPSVHNQDAFGRAWRKLLANQEEDCTIIEAQELTRAFADIIRMDQPTKLSFMRRVLNIGLHPEDKGEEADFIFHTQT